MVAQWNTSWENITKEALAALYESHNSVEISAMYGLNTEVVRRKMIKFGIERRKRQRQFNPPQDELRELYQTMTMEQIAQHYGVGQTAVWNRLREFGIMLEGYGRWGHRHKPAPWTPERREQASKIRIGKRRGVENSNWRGGATMENNRMRHLLAYRLWKEASLERANRQCQDCGVKHQTPCECCGTSITLHVHHLHSFARHPEIRFDPENSEVLCPKCHHSRHRGKSGEFGETPTA
jgi:5-methylcytosine-specific restriction endonuclease McrA